MKETTCHLNVDMSEWLRRQTRNLLGFACAGSNPAVDASFLLPSYDATGRLDLL